MPVSKGDKQANKGKGKGADSKGTGEASASRTKKGSTGSREKLRNGR